MISFRLHPFARLLATTVLALCATAFPCSSTYAQANKKQPVNSEKAPGEKPAAMDHPSAIGGPETPGKINLPPIPPDAHVQQTINMNGKVLRYTVTVGSLPVRSPEGKTIGEVVFTSYTMDGKDRPVTFAFNGGPGASSVYLNFGAIGPKHLQVGNDGYSPSDPVTLTDNPGTWLGFTDLVFIDPIGTGFSRALVPETDAKKLFYSTVPDIQYLSRIVYDWLVKNDRLTSRKYLVGESYGGFRGPRITYYLQSQLGVALNGVVLVSPYLNPTIEDNGDLSPLPWMMTLPPITAAHLEREHKFTPQAMADVIAYTQGEYVTALLKGPKDTAATEALVKRVTEMTGLDPAFVKRSGGRLETRAYLREVFREKGKIGSIYDSNVTMFDPFPYAPTQHANDPLLAAIVAPSTTAMVNFVTTVVGWKIDARYNALSDKVNELWDRGTALRQGSVTQLRQAVAADPKMRVLIAHGWNDLSCPFMASVLTVSQMPVMGDPTRVAVREYPGGHMFYTRVPSRLALQKDVMEMYRLH
ncbi:MAG TPA: peptidase S10 [Acidobacteriaceae bacterium]|nr:peptidase S10 [Acidobacteriaceae bacterium]